MLAEAGRFVRVKRYNCRLTCGIWRVSSSASRWPARLACTRRTRRRGSVPSSSIFTRRFRCFPTTACALAESRALNVAELPGRGFGGQIGVHVYLLRWRALTVGIGGEAILARASSTPPAESPELRAVDEQLVSASPQLSFNFGNGNGWSYLSGGVGRSVWSLHEAGLEASGADVEPLQTFNYGGGGRWFIKNHLAFSLDVRFYEIQAGTPVVPNPRQPADADPDHRRRHLCEVGAGLSGRPSFFVVSPW